ncbi:conserved hypothetical protein [Vibrio owensii]|uniref:immunity 8 family protein n=1 Tax=Vibrio owensii TaxID=696485 RepID=UPI002893B61C|nr:conserved hypothetical protein [Vibrio owensii]CAH1550220.1 conserved hypothetical protein [Vibrio owensii]
MQAELKQLHSPDVNFDTYWPEEIDNFSFLLQAMIGPKGEDTSESFEIHVCTPKWLINNTVKTDILCGRHMMIVVDYNIKRIEQFISNYCERCVGNNWQEVEEKLRELGRSEFQDYKAY